VGCLLQYSHDAGVLAAARKHSVIDFLPAQAHAVFKKTGLNLITPTSPTASPQSCINLFTVDSGFPSQDEGSNISIHSDPSTVAFLLILIYLHFTKGEAAAPRP
jgi:hypothetical protein